MQGDVQGALEKSKGTAVGDTDFMHRYFDKFGLSFSDIRP